MSKPKHDPLPWAYELTDSMIDGEEAFLIQSPDGDVAEVVSPVATGEANAALIVLAVNTHDDLVAVCEKLLGEYLLFRSDSLYVNKIEEEARAVLARVDKEK